MMPEMRSLLLLTMILSPLVGVASACQPQDELEYVEGDPWYIIDPGLYEPAPANNDPVEGDMGSPDMMPAVLTPLDGAWAGPEEIGDCIDATSWLEFAGDGSFAYNFLQANACIEEDARGLFACQGTWSREPAGDALQGSLSYGCQSEAATPSTPDTRGLTATYMIIERDEGASLTFKAWLQQDGAWIRTRQDLQEYPPSAEGFPRERSTTDFTSTIVLNDPSGSALRTVDDFPDLESGERAEVTIVLFIEAEVFFSFSGAREKGVEEFILPAFLERTEDGGWRLSVRFDDREPGHQGWTDYLRSQGVFTRYPVASAAFIVAFSPVLYISPTRPDGIYAPGAWRQFDGPCQTYPEYYLELLGDYCQGVE
jgi:hypothetical protein